jgi:hypothetical protein
MGILEMIAQGSAPDILGNVQKGVGISRDVMAMRAYQQEQEQAANSQKAWGSGMNNLKAAATGGGDIMPPLMELYAQDPEKAKLIQDAILSSNKERVKKFAQTLAAAGPLAFDNPKKAKEIIKQAMGQLNPQQDAPFYAGGESLLAKKDGPEFQEGMLTSLDVLSKFGFLQVEKSLSDISAELDLKKRDTSTKEKNATTAAQRAEDAKKIAYDRMAVDKQNTMMRVGVSQDANNIALKKLEWEKLNAQNQAEQGKIPKDYRKTEDGGVEPIPGSPADLEQEKVMNQKQAAYDALTSKYERIGASVKKLVGDEKTGKEPLINKGTTGRIGTIRGWTGSPEIADIKSAVKTLKSGLGFDQLGNLAAQGIKMGNLSIPEVEALQSNVADLTLEGSPKALIEKLGIIMTEYDRLVNAAKKDMVSSKGSRDKRLYYGGSGERK